MSDLTQDAALIEAVAEAMRQSPNGPWLTLPGPTDLAPGFARAAVAAVVEHLELTEQQQYAGEHLEGIESRLVTPWREVQP